MDFEIIQDLIQPADTKIVLLVMDGLGGPPNGIGYGTALEAASTPNLNGVAAQSICGLHQPAGPAITPGSGPAHLALFGCDPLRLKKTPKCIHRLERRSDVSIGWSSIRQPGR